MKRGLQQPLGAQTQRPNGEVRVWRIVNQFSSGSPYRVVGRRGSVGTSSPPMPQPAKVAIGLGFVEQLLALGAALPRTRKLPSGPAVVGPVALSAHVPP